MLTPASDGCKPPSKPCIRNSDALRTAWSSAVETQIVVCLCAASNRLGEPKPIVSESPYAAGSNR